MIDAADKDEHSYATRVVERWIRDVVVGLNLCPFARREMDLGRVRIAVSSATGAGDLLSDLERELRHLVSTPATDTVILVHPQCAQDFETYLDVLELADSLLDTRGEKGVFQIAGFHPDYCFADARGDDPANYSNRSPYPMLHVLREESVSAAVDAHPDVGSIPLVNQALLRSLGPAELETRWTECFAAAEDDP